MSAAYYPQVQKIYVAYYGRPADPAGLQYWAGQLAANGGSLTAIINAFGNSAESTALYAGADNAAKVTAIYQQLFNRSPDSAGLAFYVNELSLGRMTAASIALNVANGATGTDATYLTNKQAVASSFTDSLTTDSAAAVAYSGTAAANTARALISGVTTSAATTNVASTIAAIKPGGGAAATGQTFTLTVGADTLTGTARNDTFTAPKNTFDGDFDLIVDSSTTDNDAFNVTLDAADVAGLGTPLITNVENVNVNFDMIGTGTFDAKYTSNAVITVSSSRPTFAGSATVTNVGTSPGNNVVAGKGVTGTLTVSGMKSGYVDAGSASTVALTNAANTDTSLGYDVRVNGSVTLNPEYTGATTDRSLGLTASKDATVTLGTITGGGANVTQVLGAGSGKITLKGDVAEFSATPTITGVDTVQLMTNTAAFDLTNISSSVKLTSALDQSYTNVAGESITATGVNAVTLSARTANSSAGTVNFTKSASTLTEGANAFGSLTVNLTKDVSAFTGPVSLADAMTINVAASTTTIASQTLGAGQTLTLAGTGNVTYTAITTDATANTIDASGISGGLTATVGANRITVTGGAGNDSITSSATTASPTITTGAGADTVTMSAGITSGSPTITTGDGGDTVDFALTNALAAAKITVSTGAGDDTIKWGSGTSGPTAATTTIAIDGGDGTDTLSLYTLSDFAFATALTTGAVTISNVEVLELATAATTVKFSNALLSGASYSIKGSSGADDIQVKILASTTSTDLSKLTLDAAVEKFTVDASGALNAYTFTGSSTADVVTASANGDTISGGAGKDTITGGAGADSIDGGAGNDSIVGSAGNDTVLGGAGNDTITILESLSLNGTDTITTGAGADTIDATAVLKANVDLLKAGQTLFTVTDFTAGAGGDILSLDLSNIGTYVAAYEANSTTVTNLFLDADTISLLADNAVDNTGALKNIILVDTAANIVKANLSAKSNNLGMIAIASDTGNIYVDTDGNFISGSVIIGKITLTGTLVSDNISMAA
jgi:RTX calcium-binding nonapeptide repeat (4 copies)/Domain of unknown function (DUF4214)